MTTTADSVGGADDTERASQAGAYGVTKTQVIRLPELIEFRPDKRVRKKLFEGAQLWGELLCFEAGQAGPLHHHPREDELFVVFEGHAAISAGEDKLDASAGALVIVPATVLHDVRNVGPGRLVAMFVKVSRAFGKSAKP